jgi:hypothetical protein
MPCPRLICSSDGDLFDTLELIHFLLYMINQRRDLDRHDDQQIVPGIRPTLSNCGLS